MIKDIKYNGYTARPSGYESPDGDLDESINLIYEQGALHPVLTPACLFTVPDGCEVLLFHAGACKIYLAWNPNANPAVFHFLDEHGVEIPDCGFSLPDSGPNTVPDTVTAARIMGNTVILCGANSIHYLLWKADQFKFAYLGTCLPADLDMDFALQLDVVSCRSGFAGSLLDSSDIHASDEAYSLVFSHSYSAVASKSYYGPTSSAPFTYRVASSPLVMVPPAASFVFQKGKEYRISFSCNDLSSNPSLRIFDSAGNNDCGTRDDYLVSIRNTGAFIPDSDLDGHGLYVSVVAVLPADPGSKSVSFSIRIEEAERNTNIVPGQVIPYCRESFNAVSAAMNSFISRQAHEKNKFIYPFFVRFALRLYDGSYASISSPRLLIPNSGFTPLIFFKQDSGSVILDARAFIATLQYRINSSVPNLQDWTNIISGVDVFVSPSVWPYDQKAEYEPEKSSFDYLVPSSEHIFGVGRVCHQNDFKSSRFIKSDLLGAITDYYDTGSFQPFAVTVGRRPQKEFMEKFVSAEVSRFYLLFSLSIDDLKPSVDFITPEISDLTLNSLYSRPTLDQSLLQYTGFRHAEAHVYNSRLHIFNAVPVLPPPSHLHQLNPYMDGSVLCPESVESYVSVAMADGVVVASGSSRNLLVPLDNWWFFYPDSRATKLAFRTLDPQFDFEEVWELDLKPHPFLNGAYALVDSLDDRFPYSSRNLEPPVSSPGAGDSARSSIYVSDAANPFVFPAASVVSVGARAVLALSSAAKALSQGQFGQFPLYAFTDEGVWALEMSASGSYIARQPLTRDVILDHTRPLQIDSAVLFVSDRGIMLLSGSQAQCVSDAVNAKEPFDILQLPGMEKLHGMLGHNADTCLPTAPFLEFISECGMLYDYVHQRVIVYNPNYTYAYVFSLKSKEWGMMFSTIEAGINSYPEALAVDHNGALLNFSSMEGEATKGLFVTRPLKLETPDVLKTMDTVIQRGNFRKGHVQSVLYGSRDLFNWHLIWSSKDQYLRGFRGTPYKYFRIACVTTLAEDESIFGASLQFNPRQTNQPR